MTGLLERLDLAIQEPQLRLQTDTAVLSYGCEKKGTQSNCQTLETLARVQLDESPSHLWYVPPLIYFDDAPKKNRANGVD